jgi:(E)-4-hydroxy-3-methylbut-2-enyl-diphosphate synthase
MVRSALDYIKILEGLKFYDIVVSLKGSNIFDTIQAYRKIAKLCDYPMHLGVTATGPSYSGAIKSSIAIGALLMEGIGDTIRVSLTDRPEQEVKAAQAILGALELRNFGPEIISCPTCGRCEVNLVKIVNELDKRLSTKDYGLSTKPFKLAVMGCVVNGPGEAAQADIGVAFGRKKAVIFGKGKILGTTSEKAIIRDLMRKAR